MAGVSQPSPLYGKPDIFCALDYAGSQTSPGFDSFFLVEATQNLLVIPGSREIRGHFWLNPREALEKQRNGNIHPMAPTAKDMELLSKFDLTGVTMEPLKTHGVDTIMLEIHFMEKGNRMVFYPWDAEYGQSIQVPAFMIVHF